MEWLLYSLTTNIFVINHPCNDLRVGETNPNCQQERPMKSVQNILLETWTFLLAGGRGSRLSPLTHRRFKPAVPFGDRCIIDFTLSNCLRSNLIGPHVITRET